MTDWTFRILTGSEADFAADLNAMCAANGWQPLAPKGVLASVEFQAVARFDFDVFQLPSGMHVNARAETLPGIDPATASAVMAEVSRQIAAWFGAVQSGTSYPACPTIASYINTTLGALAPLQVGGQTWQSTGKTVLISPAPSVPKRVWA